MKIIIKWILIASTLLILTGNAHAGDIDVDDNDDPIVITGWTSQENAFTGNLRIVANDSDVDELIFLASDLREEQGEKIIGRQDVAIVGDLTLKAGVPKNFPITISNIRSPGNYSGKIELMAAGDNRSNSRSVEIIVTAKSRPKLIALAGSDNIKLHLSNSNGHLARFLLPAGAFINEWMLQLENPTGENVTVDGNCISIIGEKAGYQLNDMHISIPVGDNAIPANRMGGIRITMDRMKIPADSYVGSVYLFMKDGDDKLTIPITVDVRNGPWWAIVALLVGIVLGRLSKHMKDKEPQLKAMENVNHLENLIQGLDTDDLAILKPMMDDVRTNVYDGKLEQVTSDLKSIETRMQRLKYLRSVDSILDKWTQLGDVEQIRKDIASARNHISLREDTEADTKINTIKESMQKLPQHLPRMMGKTEPDQASAKALAEDSKKANTLLKHIVTSSTTPTPSKFDWLKKHLISLTALSDQIQAEATYWFVRPLLYIVFLLGLLAVGLQYLYIENGLTFGANPFVDYLSLILWGLSADVAGRNLSSLQGNKAGGT